MPLPFKTDQILHSNEIRDYLLRAPRRRTVQDGKLINTTHVRFKWRSELASGTIDSKINRRAGLNRFKPWDCAVQKSIRRHRTT